MYIWKKKIYTLKIVTLILHIHVSFGNKKNVPI